MHEKNIKRIIVRQLKKKVSNWSRLTKKQKKALVEDVKDDVMKEYSFEKEPD
jgi:hypothetical protein